MWICGSPGLDGSQHADPAAVSAASASLSRAWAALLDTGDPDVDKVPVLGENLVVYTWGKEFGRIAGGVYVDMGFRLNLRCCCIFG